MVAVVIRHQLSAGALALAFAVGCGPNGVSSAGAGAPDGDVSAGDTAKAMPPDPSCQAFTETTGPLPNVDPSHLSLQFWLDRLSRDYDLDEVLLTPDEAAMLDASLQVPREEYFAPRDLLAPFDVAKFSVELEERRTWMREKLDSGEYVDARGNRLDAPALASLGSVVPLDVSTPELRVAVADTQIHCAPVAAGFFSSALDMRLDRNACSALRS